MSAIFTNSDEQMKKALATKAREEAKRGKIVTEIAPLTTFTIAEDYHQKYYLRQSSVLMAEFEALFPNPADFTASTAAARANGAVGGHGLKEDPAKLGLSDEGIRELRKY